MPDLTLHIAEADSLLVILQQQFFDFQALAARYRPNDRDKNVALLGEVMALIVSRTPVSAWSPDFSGPFFRAMCALSRDAALDPTSSLNEPGRLALIARAEWLCSAAAAVNLETDDINRSQCAALWVLTLHVTGWEVHDANEFLIGAKVALAPLKLAKENVDENVKLPTVLFLSRRIASGEPCTFPLDDLRAWCAELLTLPRTRKLVSGAAKNLGVEKRAEGSNEAPLPKPPVPATPDLPTPEPQKEQPHMWPIPDVPPYETVRDRVLPSIQDLLAFGKAVGGAISQQTYSQAQQLSNAPDLARAGAVLYFAADNLWSAFSNTGNARALEMAERIALLGFQIATVSRADSKRRSNSLSRWMDTQLPRLIRACTIPDIVEDSARLCRYLSCSANDLSVRQGIVEAHVGVIRQLAGAGEGGRATELIADNWEALQQIHVEYRHRIRVESEASADEQNAWDYLQKYRAPNSGGDGPPATLLEDPDFAKIVRRGLTYESFELIDARLEEIREGLRKRLDVRLSTDHLMEPEGVVFNNNSSRYGQKDTQFVQGETYLHDGDYARASVVFERLAVRLNGRGRDISRNYQAYALAKNGDVLLARNCLRELTSSRYPYASAYWNLACCYDARLMDQQLDVLAAGVESAPHLRVLHAAVYLALLMSDDERLRTWLPLLTFSEALLLSFYLDYEGMDADRRERALMRIGIYMMSGEPEVPDPTKVKLPGAEVDLFIRKLFDRHQPEAIDFWLRCREAVASKRYDYWELRTDFLEKTRKTVEAANAFKNELNLRLKYFQQARDIAPHVVDQTRARARQWLQRCMTPELKAYGYNLYNALVQHDSNHGVKLMPRDRGIHEAYNQDRLGTTAAPDISTLLARVGAECQAKLQTVSDLALVRTGITELISVLRASKLQKTAGALDALVREWDDYKNHTEKSTRLASLERAQNAHALLVGATKSDVSPEHLMFANQLLNALQRVNSNMARMLSVLPQLEARPLEDEWLRVDPSARKTAFAVRIVGSEGSVAVRLTEAKAKASNDSVEFRSRDRLDEIPVVVGVDQSAIVTFEVQPSKWSSPPEAVNINLQFEYGGTTHMLGEPLVVPLKVEACPALPERTPYIYGRPLLSDEIEGHFFGREKEQKEIIESVRDGQQIVRYVEGIRRTGKSSLLHSIEYLISKLGLPLIPVYIPGAASNADEASLILWNFFDVIAKHDEIRPLGVEAPDPALVGANMRGAYTDFVNELASKLNGRQVAAFLDDFQALAERAYSVRDSNPALTKGLVDLLNIIREYSRPRSPLAWVFAGQIALRQYRLLVPGALLWGEMERVQVDFLGVDAVESILVAPLLGTPMSIPSETIERVRKHTSGHPESVQHIASLMFKRATEERRTILTPADADDAAHEIAMSEDRFAYTWYPVTDLSERQGRIMAAFVNAVPCGGRIEAFRLLPNKQVTDADRQAIDDLAARKILDISADGTVGIKAYVLDLWLHRALPLMASHLLNGSVAVFIDIANLTQGTGNTTLTGLQTGAGEGGIVGKFLLSTVLKRIEQFASDLSAAPIAAKWVVNYPPRAPAVVECNAQGYQVENIPEELFTKGSDDQVLVDKIWDVERGYPSVNHFVLVSGDKDYRLAVDRLLKNGKFVNVVSRASALGNPNRRFSYDSLARQYPDRFALKRLEDLLETPAVSG